MWLVASLGLLALPPLWPAPPADCCLPWGALFFGLPTELFALSLLSFFDAGFSPLLWYLVSVLTQLTSWDWVTSLVVLVFTSTFCDLAGSSWLFFFFEIFGSSSYLCLEFLSCTLWFCESNSFPALWLRWRPLSFEESEFSDVSTSLVLLSGLLGLVWLTSWGGLLLLFEDESLFLQSSVTCLLLSAFSITGLSPLTVVDSLWLSVVNTSSVFFLVVSTTSPTPSSCSWSYSSTNASCGLFSSGRSSTIWPIHCESHSLAAFLLLRLSRRLAAAFFFLMSSLSFSCSSS